MREKQLILIVDDEPNLAEILSTQLFASGYDVAMARSGEEAMKNAEELLPDLILMDIKMPKINGTDAALAIKENSKTQGIKIAFLTSQTDPWPGLAGNNQKGAQELGVDDFLQKTDDLQANVAKIKEILARPPLPPPKRI